jgi:MFS family permease
MGSGLFFLGYAALQVQRRAAAARLCRPPPPELRARAPLPALLPPGACTPALLLTHWRRHPLAEPPSAPPAGLQVPSNLVLMKLGAPLWLSIIIFTWGICATLFCTIKSVTGFYVLRFLLGEPQAVRCAQPRPASRSHRLRPQRFIRRRPGCSAVPPPRPPAVQPPAPQHPHPTRAGATEAGAFPGMWYYLSQFYPDDRITTPYAVTEAAIALSHTIAAPTAALILSFDGVGGERAVRQPAEWQWGCRQAEPPLGRGPPGRRTQRVGCITHSCCWLAFGAPQAVPMGGHRAVRSARPSRRHRQSVGPRLPAGLRGWQWLFLLEGLPSVALGLCIGFILPSSPANASFLNSEERDLIQGQLQASKPAKSKGAPLPPPHGDAAACGSLIGKCHAAARLLHRGLELSAHPWYRSPQIASSAPSLAGPGPAMPCGGWACPVLCGARLPWPARVPVLLRAAAQAERCSGPLQARRPRPSCCPRSCPTGRSGT